jgi:hypothetical protein
VRRTLEWKALSGGLRQYHRLGRIGIGKSFTVPNC